MQDVASRPGVPDAIRKIDPMRWVDNQTYGDPRVHQLELERIFDHCWLFVAHESEVSEPGDYVTLTRAETPILVVRDRQRRIRAFHNVCRHRGAQVVTDREGHCSTFRCPYHFWTYSLQGELIGVSGEEAYEGTGFHKEDFPLVELECQELFGLVFIHIQSDPEPLEEWLGPEVIEVLKKPLADTELEVIRRSSDRHELNWKVFAENARDGYHVPFVHPFFRKASPPGRYRLFRNSHAVQELGMDLSSLDEELADTLRSHPLPGVEVGEGYIVNVFPELNITLRSNVVSIDFQRLDGPRGVYFENRTLGFVGDDEETREIRNISQRAWFANPVELEDLPVFYAQQAGVRSRHVRYSVIARGEEALEGTRGDDNRLRHFWVLWRELMGVSANTIEDSS